MSVSNTTKRVKEIRWKTRRKFSSEEKIRIVLEGLRGECSGRAVDKPGQKVSRYGPTPGICLINCGNSGMG